MGAIYKRKDAWYVDLRVQGRRIRKKAGKSKKLAELFLKDIEIKAERNQLGFLERRERKAMPCPRLGGRKTNLSWPVCDRTC